MDFNRIAIYKSPLIFSFFILFSLFTSVSSLFSQTNWNTELLGRWAEGTCDAVEVDENYLYVGNGSLILPHKTRQ